MEAEASERYIRASVVLGGKEDSSEIIDISVPSSSRSSSPGSWQPDDRGKVQTPSFQSSSPEETSTLLSGIGGIQALDGRKRRAGKTVNRCDLCCGRLSSSRRLLLAFMCLFISVTISVVLTWGVAEGAFHYTDNHSLDDISIIGGGSSAIAPIMQQLARGFHSEIPSYMEVTQSDSGIGLYDLANKNTTSSFSLTDFLPPWTVKDRYNTAFFPLLAGCTSVIVNMERLTHPLLGQNHDRLRLSREALVGIFSGNITYWDDPAITEPNKKDITLVFPHEKIRPLHRSDSGSGTNYVMQTALCAFSQDNQHYKWPGKCPVSYTHNNLEDAWPIPNWASINIESCTEMVNAVAALPLSIGFVSLGFAQKSLEKEDAWGMFDLLQEDDSNDNDKSAVGNARLEHRSGDYVLPSLGSVSLAVKNAVLNFSTAALEVFDLPCKGCWPIATTHYFGIRRGDMARCNSNGKLVSAYLSWYYQETQKADSSVTKTLWGSQFSALTDAQISKVEEMVANASENCWQSWDYLSVWWIVFIAGMSTLILAIFIIALLYWWKYPLWRDIWHEHKRSRPHRYGSIGNGATLSDDGSGNILSEGLLGSQVGSSNSYDLQSTGASSPAQRGNLLLLRQLDITVDDEELTFGSEVGHGAASIVYRGSWRGTTVAIKRILRAMSSSEETNEAFLKETLIMSKLRHPNILQLLAATVRQDCFLMITEYCERGSLQDILYSPGLHLSPSLKLKIARQTARGMVYLHTKTPAVIHRDLKPSNILLTDAWTAKVADFGLSICLDDERAEMTICGTITHTAPEVLKGNLYTTKADIFSFGIVLWQLFTCERLYPSLSPIEIANAVRDSSLRPPILPRHQLPPSIHQLILQCWSEQPSSRPDFSSILNQLII